MFQQLLTGLQEAPFAQAIAEGSYLFPWIESVHILAVVTVVGSVSILDLRLIGVDAHVKSLRRLMRQVLPVTWVAFAVAVPSGFLMFASKAVKYSENWPFRIKMLLLIAAGLNTLVFHRFVHRGGEHWDEGPTPRAAKIAGYASISLWIGIVAFGRWIGFVVD